MARENLVLPPKTARQGRLVESTNPPGRLLSVPFIYIFSTSSSCLYCSSFSSYFSCCLAFSSSSSIYADSLFTPIVTGNNFLHCLRQLLLHGNKTPSLFLLKCGRIHFRVSTLLQKLITSSLLYLYSCYFFSVIFARTPGWPTLLLCSFRIRCSYPLLQQRHWVLSFPFFLYDAVSIAGDEKWSYIFTIIKLCPFFLVKYKTETSSGIFKVTSVSVTICFL